LENSNPKPSRFEQQLKTFLRILNAYPGDIPLAKYLPGFFRENRQMGSSDRRAANNYIYNYFRLGKASPNLPDQERLFLGEFLCNDTPNPFLDYFKPELNLKIDQPLAEKIKWLETQDYGFELKDVFPFHSHLSEGMDKEDFLRSFFIQPDLFIRVHPGKEELAKAKLLQEGIEFVEEGEGTLRLSNRTKLDQIFPSGKPFEIQDISSQATGTFFQPQKYDYWWDCCAASGGKSLLLYHQQPEIKLLVSDVRESVLENLDARFLSGGLKKYQKKILDLTKDPQPFIHDYKFDGVILDAPCSGSGTWGRTPEMISQFRESKIESFQRLQRSIARNVVKYIKPGKPLIYITCSVFKEENESNTEFFVKELGLKLQTEELIKGYQRKADTMYIARLIR
jgi:16S rRNA (cytosine967-C5)-methyltransferase